MPDAFRGIPIRTQDLKHKQRLRSTHWPPSWPLSRSTLRSLVMRAQYTPLVNRWFFWIAQLRREASAKGEGQALAIELFHLLGAQLSERVRVRMADVNEFLCLTHSLRRLRKDQVMEFWPCSCLPHDALGHAGRFVQSGYGVEVSWSSELLRSRKVRTSGQGSSAAVQTEAALGHSTLERFTRYGAVDCIYPILYRLARRRTEAARVFGTHGRTSRTHRIRRSS